MMLFFYAVTLIALARLAAGSTYLQTDHIFGPRFLSAFSVQNISDPTHGRVNYVDAATAAKRNLTFASKDTFILRADFETILSADGPGRNSVRLKSNKQFSTAVTIFDVRHMPQGCGTWPALWTVGDGQWPTQGEIDLLEGVNDQGTNQVTLHTGAGCTMPDRRDETGTALLDNCDVVATNNAGCGVKMKDARSYGPTFNNNGGGWYALERTDDFIKAWFWPRHAAVPADIRTGSRVVNPIKWGAPTAFFPSTMCPIADKFAPHNIIINLTFCGGWAGQASIYASSGCPTQEFPTCEDYVNNNPAAFVDAYFEFASLKVFQSI